MPFQKGQKPIHGFQKGHKVNVGRKLSKEHKKKIGNSMTGKGIGDDNVMRRPEQKERARFLMANRERTKEWKQHSSKSHFKGTDEEYKEFLFFKELRKSKPKSNKCDACDVEYNGERKNRICFDHNHKSKKFRGWLCARCNLALGLLDDNIDKLKALIKYLER
jgi:hypothetical protein